MLRGLRVRHPLAVPAMATLSLDDSALPIMLCLQCQSVAIPHGIMKVACGHSDEAYSLTHIHLQVLDQWVLAGAEETEPLYLELRHVRQVRMPFGPGDQ